ncbi:MAG: glycosyl transferase [Verrucomicrobiota bacterium]
MPDFFQHRYLTTLHYLKDAEVDEVEEDLAKYTKRRPLTLALPALYSELEQPALPRILEELKKVKYVNEIVFSMNRMDGEQLKKAKEFFSQLPQPTRIIWNDGPRFQEIYKTLEEHHLTTYVPGKGYNVWMAYGYILAKGSARVIASHDTDILSYHRDMLARLVFPVTHPTMGYEYCKSFYGRVSDRMYGRVTRLFVLPLLRSLMKTVGQLQLLDYLESFRYPLSGEFSLTTELARTLRLPGDWGLEIGMLNEVYHHTTMRRICQVDLGLNFEHKHQHLGADRDESKPAAEKGLMKMARDIALTLFSSLSSEGVNFSKSMLKTLRLTYERTARETIVIYHDDAVLNRLNYFRHEEADAVEAFAKALGVAAEQFLEEDYVSPQIPNWNRTFSAVPEIADLMVEAVEADNA